MHLYLHGQKFWQVLIINLLLLCLFFSRSPASAVSVLSSPVRVVGAEDKDMNVEMSMPAAALASGNAPSSSARVSPEVDLAMPEVSERPEEQDVQQQSDVWDGHGESKKRPTRWGRCDKCNRALAPHVYKSGPRAGRLVLLCNGFWSWNKARDKRQCFRDQEVPRLLRHFLPEYLLKQQKSVEAALKRGAVKKA